MCGHLPKDLTPGDTGASRRDLAVVIPSAGGMTSKRRRAWGKVGLAHIGKLVRNQ